MNRQHAVDSRHLEAQVPQRTQIPAGLEFHHVEAGQGRPLVLVHGVLGDWRTWAPQWAAFTPHFRTISYSRRYSVPNRNAQPSPDHSALVEAQDLAALLPAWGASPAILVGSSYGAFTALALAVTQPHLVQGLVLLEPPMLRWADLAPGGQAIREAFDREIRQPARAAFQRGDIDRGVALLTGGIVGPDVLASLPPEALRRRRENERSLRMLSLSTDEFPMIDPATVQAVDVPTLLLAGERTPPIHDTVFRALCAAMPQAEQDRIPDAGHGAARDNPEAFNRRVLQFLADQGWGG